MSEEFETKYLKLLNDREIYLNDQDEVFISLKYMGQELSRVDMPWPSAGYGGGSLIASPSQKYLVFSYYSGQSEEAFKLYKLGENLKEIFSTGYQFGEAASFGFSDNESLLAMAYPYSCSEWWMPWDDDELEDNTEGSKYLDFGEIYILDIGKKIESKHVIRLNCPDNCEPYRGDYEPYLSPTFDSKGNMSLAMPWGNVELQAPFSKIILFNPPCLKENA